MKRRFWPALFLVCIFALSTTVLIMGCDNEEASPAGPVITSVVPLKGEYYSNITAYGSNFGVVQDTNKITMHGVDMEVVKWSDTSIEARVPDMDDGLYRIIVHTSCGDSNVIWFEVLP